MNDIDLSENGSQPREEVIRFVSLDTGDEVLAYPSATAEGHVSLSLAHEMDGDLEVVMDLKTAEEVALALARAADEARRNTEEDEG
ncbi:MAG: hypothetical protein ABSB96_11555 [Gaiellaceae bacterium]